MGIKAVRIAQGWPKAPGEYILTGRQDREGKHGMVFACPCGCGDVSGINFDTVPRDGADDQRWSWDSNEDAPTLTPSLHKSMGCGWHGFLRAGEFVPC